MSAIPAEQIAAGLAVFHVSNPGRLGVLTGNRLDAMFPMAEVDWGDLIEFVDATKLRRRNSNRINSTMEDVREGRYGTVEDLRRRVTFEKLQGTLTDVFYSMKTSEIDFYAHQFKPVLRFIESATNRLLIADEVGLGKTIEAGLIWTEWQAREKARRLLIVCPPTLVPKWLREMQDRFQFAAEATNAKHLQSLLERFDRSGPGMSFCLVTSYHSIRPLGAEKLMVQQIRNGKAAKEVVGFGEAVPPRVQFFGRLRDQAEEAMLAGPTAAKFLDMVVFDEAHIMRNTGSASYLVGEMLSMAAASAVCLSATPIHNNSRDLYALMRLIDPEVFRDKFVFDRLVQENLPHIQLQNALARTIWENEAILKAIAAIPSATARQRIKALYDANDGSPRHRVELRHAAERLNLLGNFINRTRKRDIIENRVIRRPITLKVKMAKEEELFYLTFLKFLRKESRANGDAGTAFKLQNAAQRMASCVPVIVEELREGRWGDPEELELLREDFEFEGEVPENFAINLGELAAINFEAIDSKYSKLKSALNQISENATLKDDLGHEIAIDRKDKVIIFAFFKKTIAYLQDRLERDGIKASAVTGDITDKMERDRLLQEFAKNDHRVLLCSEIGAEGVDLQFARVVINYDLPWNPMRVEQRIGRIDRIGQQAATIGIINFHVEDTIDGNIYANLYAKLGVFERSIGSMEGILGEEVKKLNKAILSEELTPEMMNERAKLTAQAICQKAQIESDLEGSNGALFAFQDLLSEQIGESQRLGKFIRPSELEHHLIDFLAKNYHENDACNIQSNNPASGCFQVNLSFGAFSDFEGFCQRVEHAWPVGFNRSNRQIHLTFDPEIHQKLKSKHRSLVLVTHLHPFFRWITEVNTKKTNNWHKVSAIALRSPEVAKDCFFFLIYRLTMSGVTRKDSFQYALKSLSTGQVLLGQEAEMIVKTALDYGESAFLESVDDHSIILVELKSVLAQEIAKSQDSFKKDQELKFEIRKQQLLAHFNRRIESQTAAINTARARGMETNKLAGFAKILENLVQKRDFQLILLEEKAKSSEEVAAEVACGLIDNKG
jgi:superfamily II DNA or RNA helicase